MDVLTDYFDVLSPKDLVSLSLANHEWRHIISKNIHHILYKKFGMCLANTDIHLQDMYIVWNRFTKNKRYDFKDDIRFSFRDTYESNANTTLALTSLCNRTQDLWASYYLFKYLWDIRYSEFFLDMYDFINIKVHQALYDCMLRRKSRNKLRLMSILTDLSQYVRYTGNALLSKN